VTKHGKENENESIPVSKAIIYRGMPKQHKRRKCQMRNQNAPLMIHLLCCVIQKEEEGASKNDRHGRHQEDPKWIYTS